MGDNAMTTYEYSVQTVGTGTWDNLEAMASQVQTVLNLPEEQGNARSGWELWQTNALHDGHGLSGFLLIYRRARA